MSRQSVRRVAVLVVLAAAVAASSACGGGTERAGTGAAPPTVAEVTVWFSDEEGRLVAETRPASGGGSALDAAMEALAAGPSDPALLPALPSGTPVLGTGVAGGVATVDLGPGFESGYPAAGSAAELAVLGPLVRTASEAAGVPRVRILVEGRVPEPPAAQLDLSRPLSAADVAAGG
jgi:spore germination protein GerM